MGRLAVDVFYPARRGSYFGEAAAVFDIRTFLPASQQGFVSDARNPAQVCDCFADLPPDDIHGPWPVVVFVHGTAAFSTQSLSDVTHWASRGVVVVAATHPGLYLADSLSIFCPDDATGPRDLDGDLDALLAAVGGGGAGIDFLAGALSDRIALVGHSAGANAVVEAGNRLDASPEVDVVVSLAGSAALERAGVAFLAMAARSWNSGRRRRQPHRPGRDAARRGARRHRAAVEGVAARGGPTGRRGSGRLCVRPRWRVHVHTTLERAP